MELNCITDDWGSSQDFIKGYCMHLDSLTLRTQGKWNPFGRVNKHLNFTYSNSIWASDSIWGFHLFCASKMNMIL